MKISKILLSTAGIGIISSSFAVSSAVPLQSIFINYFGNYGTRPIVLQQFNDPTGTGKNPVNPQIAVPGVSMEFLGITLTASNYLTTAIDGNLNNQSSYFIAMNYTGQVSKYVEASDMSYLLFPTSGNHHNDTVNGWNCAFIGTDNPEGRADINWTVNSDNPSTDSVAITSANEDTWLLVINPSNPSSNPVTQTLSDLCTRLIYKIIIQNK